MCVCVQLLYDQPSRGCVNFYATSALVHVEGGFTVKGLKQGAEGTKFGSWGASQKDASPTPVKMFRFTALQPGSSRSVAGTSFITPHGVAVEAEAHLLSIRSSCRYRETIIQGRWREHLHGEDNYRPLGYLGGNKVMKKWACVSFVMCLYEDLNGSSLCFGPSPTP